MAFEAALADIDRSLPLLETAVESHSELEGALRAAAALEYRLQDLEPFPLATFAQSDLSEPLGHVIRKLTGRATLLVGSSRLLGSTELPLDIAEGEPTLGPNTVVRGELKALGGLVEATLESIEEAELEVHFRSSETELVDPPSHGTGLVGELPPNVG
jgi:hypothetical protein